ncbi:MAG: alanine racemase, partial [Bacteroidetes bacterium HGW-Bacteroidetes-4]
KISQEHGIVNVPAHLMHEFKVGDLIYIVPVHSCLTANLLGEPYFID